MTWNMFPDVFLSISLYLLKALDKGQGSKDQTFSILKAGTVLLNGLINTVL